MIAAEEQQQKEKQYVLVTAVRGGNLKKLHWVIAEKRKNEAWFLKGKPVRSLCGKRASRLVEHYRELPLDKWEPTEPGNPLSLARVPFTDFFIYYDKKELYDELKGDYERSQRRKKERIRWHAGQAYVKPRDTLAKIKERMWCRECKKVKEDQYPHIH